ncbi:MAG: MBL fold metallo-hydrolase [Spirochaetales bacterium]|nr:MBL fold metallo-hydrolase [Spirochaetales bacterium]
MSGSLRLGSVLALVLLAATACAKPAVPSKGAAAEPQPERPRLTAYRYGVSPDMHWLFYSLRKDGKTILIDCGFLDEDRARAFKVEMVSPLVMLDRDGIIPADVTDIVITHAHFDHLGLASSFPNATIWIHEDAYASFMKAPFSKTLAAYLAEYPRVNQVRTDGQILPGIAMELVGTHTRGSCVVHLDLAGTPATITGDEFYFRHEWEQPSSSFPPAKLALAERLRALEAAGGLVLAMHDQGVAPEGSAAEGSIKVVYP